MRGQLSLTTVQPAPFHAVALLHPACLASLYYHPFDVFCYAAAMLHLSDLPSRLAFIQEAERLKTVLRSAHSSGGRQESTAEHSWRLCLLAMTLQDLLGPLDMGRVLQLCVVHDLGEALHGDVPAPQQSATGDKDAQERRDLLTLAEGLPAERQAWLLGLWEEYTQAQTLEARVVKALDKIETIIQHNQGANPPDFDYAFNLDYGRRHADVHPVIAELRALVDADTRQHAERAAAQTVGRTPLAG